MTAKLHEPRLVGRPVATVGKENRMILIGCQQALTPCGRPSISMANSTGAAPRPASLIFASARRVASLGAARYWPLMTAAMSWPGTFSPDSDAASVGNIRSPAASSPAVSAVAAGRQSQVPP